METTILTVLGLFATVTLWILTSIKSDIKKFEEKTETRFDRLEMRVSVLEKTTAVILETLGNVDKRLDSFEKRMDSFEKRMDSMILEIRQLNQNFIDHLRHDHGIQR